MQEGEPGRAARIVFDRADGGFRVVLETLEIDDTDFLFVAATDAAGGAAAIMITATGALADFDQALLGLGLGNVAEIGIRDIACRWRQRSKCFYWHKSNSPNQVSYLESRTIIPAV